MSRPRSLVALGRRGTAAERLVTWVQQQIAAGALRPGQRLPPERELAVTVGVSRPSVRAGLRTLAAMRVIVTRHGAGSSIADGPPRLDGRSLALLGTLHRFESEHLRQMRLMLEIEAVQRAATHANSGQLAELADLVSEGFVGFADGRTTTAHDLAFHGAVASASGNPVLALLLDVVLRLLADKDRPQRGRTNRHRDDALAHQRIYRALRSRDVTRARAEVRAHLLSESGAVDDADEVPIVHRGERGVILPNPLAPVPAEFTP